MGQATMPKPGGEIRDVRLTTALGERYLSYALSTILSRSLPDVRDGRKPVHRRPPWPHETGRRGHGGTQQQSRGLFESETHGPSPSVAASGVLGGPGGGAGFTVSSRWRKYR